MEVPLTAGPSTGSVDGSGGCCRSTARQLQLCKLLYFLEGFSFASFGRFATLYYLSRGLDAHEIGLIEACRPATAIVGGVLFGWLSDRLRRKKAVFLATRVASDPFAKVGHRSQRPLVFCAQPATELERTTA